MEAFYEEIKNEGGLKVNPTKTEIYSPNENNEGKPQEFQIGPVTAILTKLPNDELIEITKSQQKD